MRKLIRSNSAVSSPMENEYTSLKANASAVQRIRISAQRELELAKQMRAEAQRYQHETEIKARSQAQQLILRARLATQKEMEEFIRKEIEILVRKASAETHKILADIRMIRITAQEELAALRKFTDAARIYSLSLSTQKETGEPKEKRKKQLVGKK